MSNKLKNETSPYLLQHAENPVNWYPWGEEAFRIAKEEDKPIFLSIGYSTCHWCHVMAHESFEDSKTAEILNRHFISIKVDREERPDIDSVYMSVCQAFTGHGGWPMSIFMTWDKKPFFAGTYFPVRSQYGIPGFTDLLEAIISQWTSDRSELIESAQTIISHLQNAQTVQKGKASDNLTEKALKLFEYNFDKAYGGFGPAPKFPTPHNLIFLMLYAKQNNSSIALQMSEKTLLQMRKGGIFDHLGYGFSRYSTDKYFLAPHFEKMLYDNALLIIAYSIASNLTDNRVYLETAKMCADYILREMTSPEGAFYSAQDADSEGVEGKYYTFTQSEIYDVLGALRGKEFCEVFDITPEGNFEGVNIPNLLKSNALNTDFEAEIRNLYDYRKKRFSLHLDDKVLLSWNSLMIAALSILYRVSKNEKYLLAAQKAQDFIEKNLCEDTKLYTSFREKKHSEHGFIDDYAFYTAALIELYNSTLNESYLKKAELFLSEAINRFLDHENGGFYLSEKDKAELFINPKESYDGAIPSANSVMAYNLVRLNQLTDNKYSKHEAEQIAYMSAKAYDYPSGHSMFLIALLLHENPPQQIRIVLKDNSDTDNVKGQLPLLSNITVVKESTDYPLINNQTTYYICKNHVCLPPTNTPEF